MSQSDLIGDFFLVMWAYTYYKIVISMTIFFLIYLVIKNPGLVDFAWSANYAIVATNFLIIYWTGAYAKPILVTVLVYIWFIRLGGLIMLTRIIPGHKDARYENMVDENSNKFLFFFIQYQFQGVLVIICASPLYFCYQNNQVISWTFYVGAILIVIGILFETIADNQLNDYKNRKSKEAREARERQVAAENLPKNTDTENNNSQSHEQPADQALINKPPAQKGIFNEGLWRQSRHPNLFFELCVWVGFSIIGLGEITGQLGSFFGFLGPIALYLIMNFITVPVTEQYMKESRGQEWIDFCQETNQFWIF